MHLVQLVYFSRPVSEDVNGNIEAILRSSRAYNSRSSVTGMLCFRDDYYLQVLEGARTAVSETFSRVSMDSRHKNVVLVGYQPAAERAFTKWSMHWVPITDESILRYSTTDRFQPDTMSFPGTIEFMKEIAARQPRSTAAGPQPVASASMRA